MHPEINWNSSTGRRQPFVAKIAKSWRIRLEREKHGKYVANQLPFRNRPNISNQRTILTTNKGILVEDFVDRAILLKDVIKTGNAGLLVASLFDVTLRSWRLAPIRELGLPFNNFFRRNAADKLSLAPAAKDAKEKFAAVMEVEALFQILQRLPEQYLEFCNVHGDLHTRNIFVVAGTTDLILLDFFRVDAGPTAIDPASLEVDLALNLGYEIPWETIEPYFAYPVPRVDATFHDPRHVWFWEAIRAIRLYGCAKFPQTDEYAFALISYFLQFATFKDVGKEDARAKAYYLAQDLAKKVAADKGVAI